MGLHREQRQKKLELAQQIIGYTFKDENILLPAITHPSAVEGKPVKCSYERLEFLGDSVLGGIVAKAAFDAFPRLDEGGLTRIKVALVSGSSLSRVASDLGFADAIIFGLSERGTGRRGLHSALENVYEAVVAALFLDGGLSAAVEFVERTLICHMSIDMAKEPENPKSITQVLADDIPLAQGTGRTKKESESSAAKCALEMARAEGGILALVRKAKAAQGC